MLSCEQVRAELSDLVDGEVMPEMRRDLERHISECQTCRVLYDSTRKTLTIVTESGSFELPEALSQRLTARILAAVREARAN